MDAARANSVLMELGFALFLVIFSRFLTANRFPLRLKMLYPALAREGSDEEIDFPALIGHRGEVCR
jgi:hypothetical protein